MTTFTADTPGPITLDLTAPVADVTIQTSPDLRTATMRVDGPSKDVAGSTAHMDGTRWIVRITEPSPTMIHRSGGGVTNTVFGNISGGAVVVSSGDLSISGGTVFSGGNVFAAAEPVRITVTLPADSNVRINQPHGESKLHGRYAAVDFRSSNAGLELNGHADYLDADTTNGSVSVIGTVSEEINTSATNGTLTLASSAPRTIARATNGSVTVAASGPHSIRARTTNGSLTVLKNGHDADVTSSTTNGSELVR